jgi:hypothetical protein
MTINRNNAIGALKAKLAGDNAKAAFGMNENLNLQG